jgi:DNA (cytosine-5)-methyltransferase 1
MKVLNLYAGIGGNRKLWNGVDCTAVEIEPKIAKIYGDLFPDDKVVVGDAHQYLLNHYNDGWDFIWSSPPCQTHSGCNNFLNAQGVIRYPDMSLWQEILFLKQFCKCKWIVENVKSYYEPMIKPQVVGRHFIWSNFNVSNYSRKFLEVGTFGPTKKGRTDVKDKIRRNCVDSNIGRYIFDCAFKLQQKKIEG